MSSVRPVKWYRRITNQHSSIYSKERCRDPVGNIEGSNVMKSQLLTYILRVKRIYTNKRTRRQCPHSPLCDLTQYRELAGVQVISETRIEPNVAMNNE